MICLTKLFQQKRRRIGYILAFSDPTISKRDSSELVGIISNQRKTLDLLKQEKMLVKQQVNMGRLNSDQYLRIKSSELKASNEYFVYIQEFYLLIFKYRYLALYDILRDKDL